MKQISLLALAALAFSACGPSGTGGATSGGDISGCSTRAYGSIGGPISLIDHTGKRVTEEDYKGKDTLIYFGFTYCAAACPITLQLAGSALDQLPDGFEKPRTLLISFDPERDTPEQLAKYVDSNGFPADLTGLTGTEEDVAAAMSAFRTYKVKVDMPDSAAGYTFDHPDMIYMMDKDWKLKTFFPIGKDGLNATDIAECIVELSE